MRPGLRAAATALAALALTLPLSAASPPPAGPTTCETVPPGKNQYRLAVGYATARSNAPAQREAALAAARAEAEQRLAEQLCTVLPAESCTRYAGYVQAWQTPGVYDPTTRRACATAVVESWLLEPDALRKVAEGSMTRFADALAATLDTRGVRLGELRRSDGCAVPELDPARMWVRARLAAAKIPVYGEEAPPGTPTLDLLATVAAGTVTLGATVRSADGTESAVTPASFPAAAYAVPEGRSCAAAPSGDNHVRIDLDTRGGALCAGQPFEPRLSVAAPSRVHVFSVAADGTAWHIWPEPGGDGRVDGVVSLGASYATRPVSPGDEQLVAVAIPADAPATPLDRVSGFCRLGRPFAAEPLPAGARVSSTSWRVDTRPGACGAPPPGQPTDAELAAAIAAAPLCP